MRSVPPSTSTQPGTAPDAPPPTAADARGLFALDVASPSFLIEKIGSECAPLQGLRELTVNGFEAIEMGAGTGRIVWDLDWERVEGSNGKVRKWSVTDTGVGMSHEMMNRVINSLASSGKTQSKRANFGIGAKVACGPRNPHGLEYKSWHDGEGALVRFARDEDGNWGLVPQTWPDGRVDYWLPLTEDDKPWLLRGEHSGTQVTLLGNAPAEDTTGPPPEITEAKQRWCTRALNTRFFDLPDGVELLVRENSKVRSGTWKAGDLVAIHGQAHFLERRSLLSGVCEIPDARVHWWILDEDHKGRRAEGYEWQSTGHTAALFENELYDLMPPTRGGYQRLAEWGIRFGYERVVLYVESTITDDRLEANIARTTLLLDHEPLPWSSWGEQFRANMPAELREMQERIARQSSGGDRRKAIQTRLQENSGLFRLSTYRPPRTARSARLAEVVEIDGDVEDLTVPAPAATVAAPPAGTADSGPVTDGTDLEPAATGESTPEAAVDHATEHAEPTRAPEEDEESQPAPAPELRMPEVIWVSQVDQSRPPGDLEDRAARYDRETHTLIINADFRVYSDLVDSWLVTFGNTPGTRQTVEPVVREWCETALVEVVVGATALSGSAAWNDEDLDRLLSPEALTASSLVRIAAVGHMKRGLSQRLGRQDGT